MTYLSPSDEAIEAWDEAHLVKEPSRPPSLHLWPQHMLHARPRDWTGPLVERGRVYDLDRPDPYIFLVPSRFVVSWSWRWSADSRQEWSVPTRPHPKPLVMQQDVPSILLRKRRKKGSAHGVPLTKAALVDMGRDVWVSVDYEGKRIAVTIWPGTP